MKMHIALAAWLAASGYAWAADGDTAPQSTAANSVTSAGWVMSTGPGATENSATAAGTASRPVTAPVQTEAQESGQDPLPPPPSMLYGQARESISPVTPDETRELKVLDNQMDQAVSTQPISVVPRISAQTVDLSPGASLPLVRTAVNYPSSVSFIDSTGAPWKIGAKPLGGSSAFIAYYIPNTHLMTVFAKEAYKTGNITVYLEGLEVPIVLTVTSGESDSAAKTWTVDSRLDLRLPRRGPAALASAPPEMRIGLHDQTLQAFLDGVPPKEARRLKTTGAVPETSVWQLGDDLYVRTRAEIRDEFEATLSSADGMHLWKLPVTPYISFSVMGRTEALSVALE